MISVGLEKAEDFEPSRRILATASRLYRFWLNAYHIKLSGRLRAIRQRLLGPGAVVPDPLPFLKDLRLLKRRPDPDPDQAWEEVNRFHQNKRRLLAGLLAGEKAVSGTGALPTVPQPTGRGALTKTVDDFVALLIDRQIEAVSFDLFDTLVCRLTGTPRNVFLAIDRQLAERWPLDRPFSLFRIAAEEKVRQSSPREEVSLAEIYEEMAGAAGLDEARKTELLNLEIASELKFIRPRAVGVELLKKAREHLRRIYLISDTYLGREQIGRIIDSCGLGDFSALYLSSEEGKTKHTGHLFDSFLREEGLPARKTLHVGDNRQSDRDSPARRGIGTFLIEREETGATRASGRDGNRLPDAIFSSLEQSALKSTREIQGEFGPRYGGDPFLLGYCALGPLLLGFTSRLYQAVKRGGFSRLYFVSRDGYYFQSCYELVRRHDPSLPPSTYLYSSRKLIYRALMTDEEKIVETAERAYFPSRLRDLLTGRFFFSEQECDSIPSSILQRYG
ncbi:MAG: hypothetical protein P9M08_04050, partial [Candidatus Erginobacter occultus]|nr:hypothetical protein [Candidatus Erginobacter occultus]